MLIAIVGTPSAGKRTVLDYLVARHGFRRVGLTSPSDPMDAARLVRKSECPRPQVARAEV
jgi:dCMP deaminase